MVLSQTEVRKVCTYPLFQDMAFALEM